jgi:hypothetical protein
MITYILRELWQKRTQNSTQQLLNSEFRVQSSELIEGGAAW